MAEPHARGPPALFKCRPIPVFPHALTQVNYPRSAKDSTSPSPYYAPAPDDAFFVEASTVYANAHPTMSDSTQFPGGITNGAMWCALPHPLPRTPFPPPSPPHR